MSVDPFADPAPTTATNENTTVKPPWDEAAVPASTNGEVSVTLKGGSGYDAPWIVIKAPTVQAAREALDDENSLKALIDKTAAVGAYFSAKGGGTPRPPKPATGSQPQGKPPYQQPPGGEQRYCRHAAELGPMVWRSGISNAGKPYAGWYCPSRDRSDQCRPQYPTK
ncbi:hypothetical protein GCM10012275_15250 [Longimycelium tulufanense]|uniref:Uncharacterized protein n=1 Tax=Longimycelium tulufanense TaxID=907463 RepID=A0A8J3CBZ7_9PSEU|nr:hypothetical protein [Longimycelium tulufanense]GGM45143.1 hypothetical protein GCM10012275_15250 [Longimycelium tulufanense]